MSILDTYTPPPNPGDTLRRVLVIKLGAMGDFMQALGAMRVVRATHPSARITLLTTEPFEAFAKACPYFDIVEADGRPRDTMIFWTTGLLSSFLDNAPTYLVFFNLAGGDAQRLMGPLGTSLAALSMGAVYFGALTYIGNAPNFMIKAIAEDRGVAMPSFFAYFAWAALVMLPLLAAVAAICMCT